MTYGKRAKSVAKTIARDDSERLAQEEQGSPSRFFAQTSAAACTASSKAVSVGKVAEGFRRYPREVEHAGRIR